MGGPMPVVEATGLGKSFGSGDKRVVVLDGCRPDGRQWRGRRAARPERRRQDDHRPDPGHPAAAGPGSATVAGFDVTRDAARVRERVSLTGQHAAVDGKLSGAENLTMMGRLAHRAAQLGAVWVDQLLVAFDLVERRRPPGGQLLRWHATPTRSRRRTAGAAGGDVPGRADHGARSA